MEWSASSVDLLAAHYGGFEAFVSGEMATEVETLLSRNPLLQQEEQDRCQADKDGGFLVKEQSLKRAKDESNSQAKESPDSAEDDALKKEFTEAPPPKVNPWTKKMSGVNGQTQHGQYHRSKHR